jgi:flavin-dependent dehydrogenase
MRVETPAGTHVRLTYGSGSERDDLAIGFERGRLDPWLLRRATVAGATVRRGAAVASVTATPSVHLADGKSLTARVLVGADGLRSIVARHAGVSKPSPFPGRVALSYHITDPYGDGSHDARMVVIDDGYVGLAPVPGHRINVGIVLGPRWADRLRRDGARVVAAEILQSLPADRDGQPLDPAPLDEVAGIAPLGALVRRRSGPRWLLVGDAAGFLDPFTGEGLHRAIRSAELAAETIDATLRGRGDLRAYDRAMASRFGAKDLVTRIVHLFLGRPRLFEYAARRLASRSRERETLGLVIGDLLPASRAIDPRYLAAVLAP